MSLKGLSWRQLCFLPWQCFCSWQSETESETWLKSWLTLEASHFFTGNSIVLHFRHLSVDSTKLIHSRFLLMFNFLLILSVSSQEKNPCLLSLWPGLMKDSTLVLRLIFGHKRRYYKEASHHSRVITQQTWVMTRFSLVEAFYRFHVAHKKGSWSGGKKTVESIDFCVFLLISDDASGRLTEYSWSWYQEEELKWTKVQYVNKSSLVSSFVSLEVIFHSRRLSHSNARRHSSEKRLSVWQNSLP